MLRVERVSSGVMVVVTEAVLADMELTTLAATSAAAARVDVAGETLADGPATDAANASMLPVDDAIRHVGQDYALESSRRLTELFVPEKLWRRACCCQQNGNVGCICGDVVLAQADCRRDGVVFKKEACS